MNQQRIRPLYSLARSIPCQAIGYGFGLLAADYGGIAPLAVHGLVALFTSMLLRLPLPWRIFNLLLPATIVLSLHGPIGTTLAAAFVGLVLLLYLPTYWTRVPWYPSHRSVEKVLLELLPPDRDFTFVDLGCGGATLLCRLAKRAGRGSFIGYEISPLAVFLAFCRAAITSRSRVEIRAKNFWNADLSEFSLIYAFLSPEPMETLWTKVQAEATPGTLFLSNTFQAPAKPDQEIALEGALQRVLYLYRVPRK